LLIGYVEQEENHNNQREMAACRRRIEGKLGPGSRDSSLNLNECENLSQDS
jgi:hypothetical protein